MGHSAVLRLPDLFIEEVDNGPVKRVGLLQIRKVAATFLESRMHEGICHQRLVMK
jgi:hypothetical protein